MSSFYSKYFTVFGLRKEERHLSSRIIEIRYNWMVTALHAAVLWALVSRSLRKEADMRHTSSSFCERPSWVEFGFTPPPEPLGPIKNHREHGHAGRPVVCENNNNNNNNGITFSGRLSRSMSPNQNGPIKAKRPTPSACTRNYKPPENVFLCGW